MNLQGQIKQDLTAARYAKNLDVISILSTLLGEASMIGKSKRNSDSTDEEVIGVVKKFLVNNEETLKHHEFINPDSEMCKKLRFETQVICKYLPVQMTDEEMIVIIKDIIAIKNLSSVRELGVVMGELKRLYSGMYDGARAKQLVTECLV